MMRPFLPVLFALFLTQWSALAANTPVKLKVGDTAPQFSQRDVQGHLFDLKAQRGKVVLINFWASWCAPCILEIPHLNQLQKQFGGRGFQVVGISMEDSASSTKEMMQKIAFNYPVV